MPNKETTMEISVSNQHIREIRKLKAIFCRLSLQEVITMTLFCYIIEQKLLVKHPMKSVNELSLSRNNTFAAKANHGLTPTLHSFVIHDKKSLN